MYILSYDEFLARAEEILGTKFCSYSGNGYVAFNLEKAVTFNPLDGLHTYKLDLAGYCQCMNDFSEAYFRN